MKNFTFILFFFSFLGNTFDLIAQDIETVNTSSATSCDGYASIINPPSSPWTWNWYQTGNSSIIQSGGNSLSNLCASGVSYYVEFSAPGETPYNVFFYIYNNCYGFSLSIGTGNTAADECTGYIIGYFQGGMAPYNISWSNGSTSDTLTQLCEGTYSFLVSDSQGCENDGSVSITIDTNLSSTLTIDTVYITHDDVSANCTGSIAILPNGGAPPYTVTWSNGPVAYQFSNPDLCPGVYFVTLADVSGESVSDTISIHNTNVIFSNNPFPDSIVVDIFDLGLIENCDLDYATITTSYLYNASIDTILNEAILTWVIVDAIDSTFYTDTLDINNLNGVFGIVIGFYCPQRSMGTFIQCENYIYIHNGSIQTATISELSPIEIDVFPNPFDNELEVNLSVSNDYLITIYDVNGVIKFQQLYPATTLAHCKELYLDHGVYFLSIEWDTNRVFRKMVR